jgi:preprotein translocase subunit YajC
MHSILDAFLAQSAEGQQSPITALLPFVAIAVVFYFIFFRPQQKQRKQHETFLQGLKKGDEVITQSGIIGEVVAVEDRVVTINVGGGTKLRILKAQVAGQWKEIPQGEARAEKK